MNNVCKVNVYKINIEPTQRSHLINPGQLCMLFLALHPLILLSAIFEECDICHFQTCFPFTHTIKRFGLVCLFIYLLVSYQDTNNQVSQRITHTLLEFVRCV